MTDTNSNGNWPARTTQGDPAPTPGEVAEKQMQALLDKVTTHTLDQLRELRDEIDNLMRVIQARNEIIRMAFTEHVNYAAETLNCKNIIKQNLVKISDNFKAGMEIPKNVTVKSNE